MWPMIMGAVVLLVLEGCVTPPWEMVQSRYVPESKELELELPAGWKQYNLLQKDDPTVMRALTRDGFALQAVFLKRMTLEMEFKNTKKKLSQGMLPQEVAEVFFDDVRSDPNKTNQQVLEQGPIKLGERSGFKILYSYQTKTGLKKQGLCYGLLNESTLYALVYEAPIRYYFARDLTTFEKIKDSFRILQVTHT
jgi:hypothetical protein